MQRKTPIWALSAIVILGVGGFFITKDMASKPQNADILAENQMIAETIAMQKNNQDILIGSSISKTFNNVSPAAGDDEANTEEDMSDVMIDESAVVHENMVEPQNNETVTTEAHNDTSTETPEEKTQEEAKIEETAETQDATSANADEKLAKMEENPLMSVRAIGNPDAPVVMEGFSSFSCPHCADFHEEILPLVKEKYIDTGKVYLIFRDYPLNKPAVEAAGIARCMPQDEYYDFVTVLFRTQREWVMSGSPAKLLQTAKLAGLTDDDLKACMGNKDLIKFILAKMQASSNKYDITSTPTFVFNHGEVKIKGAKPFEQFAKQIDELLAKVDDSVHDHE